MQLIAPGALYTQDAYETLRAELRRRIITAKARRRVSVAAFCTIHFENRDTMFYQIQEMLRAENNWHDAEATAAELAAYNPLIPQHGELSARLIIEKGEINRSAQRCCKNWSASSSMYGFTLAIQSQPCPTLTTCSSTSTRYQHCNT